MRHHILYLGRNQNNTADLRNILCNEIAAPSVGGSAQQNSEGLAAGDAGTRCLLFEVVASQKEVMRRLNHMLPTVIMVETSNKPESRLRFCRLLRERAPAVAIVAIGASILPYRFAFDGTLRTPLNQPAVHALLQNLQQLRYNVMRTRGSISLNLATRRVTTPRGEEELTPKECALLAMLMENEGKTVSRTQIIRHVWETSYMDDTRTLDVHMRWLRKKIEVDPSDPVYIRTKRGEGYYFTLPEE